MNNKTDLDRENEEDLLALEERADEPVMKYSELLDELQAAGKLTTEDRGKPSRSG